MKPCNPSTPNQFKIEPLQFGDENNSFTWANLSINLTSQSDSFTYQPVKTAYRKLYRQNRFKIKPIQIDNNEGSFTWDNLLLEKQKLDVRLTGIIQNIKYSSDFAIQKANQNLEEFVDLDSEKLSQISNQDTEVSTLDILKEFGLIGCISAEPDLSTNYKSVIREELDSKYDHR